MESKEMKFLAFKPSKAGKEHRFHGGSSEEKQPHFLGTWKSKNQGSWLCSPQTVVKQLQKILDSDEVHAKTKLQDLSKVNRGQLTHLRRALLIKNPQKSYNPWKFYVLLDKVNYCLKRTNWMKYFPPFRSAIEAHRNLPVLLGMFYNMYHAKYKDPTNQKKDDEKENWSKFVAGQLVLVKFMKERKSESSYSYEVRRGFVENTSLGQNASQCIYTVYLLDFGFRLEVSDHFMCPLPRPFNCIAPLAIQCSLYGVSQVGEKWCNEALNHFSELLESHADSIFVVDIISDRLLPKPLLLNINVCNIEVMDKKGQKRRRRIKFEINLTQFMINSQMGSQWNFFPARPKLMGGVTPSLEGQKNPDEKLPRTTVSFQDALLMTRFYVPNLHMRLPKCVIRKEFKKLFRLSHLSEIMDMKNYLVVQTADQNDRLKTPCSLKMLKADEQCGKDQAVPTGEDQK